jgi:thiol-disulfide isomerase/thioredoxin
MTRPILLDFMADWCMPCNAMKPILAELEKEYDFELRQINVDEMPEATEKLNIASIPTLLLTNSKHIEIGRLVGAQSKENILKMFNGKVQRKKHETI